MPNDTGQQFMNPSNVVFAPFVGNAYPIDRVELMSYRENSRSASFAGDTDAYPTAVAQVSDGPPEVRITTLSPASLDAIPSGTRGLLTWVIDDAFNSDTPEGGAVRYTLAHVMFLRHPVEAPFGKYVATTYKFQAQSSNGQCPLTYAPV